eukprot:229477-Chlamydomonas_euryale.AAC.10
MAWLASANGDAGQHCDMPPDAWPAANAAWLRWPMQHSMHVGHHISNQLAVQTQWPFSNPLVVQNCVPVDTTDAAAPALACQRAQKRFPEVLSRH